MALPKKGMRKITVDGAVYSYVIKQTEQHPWKNSARLTIQMADGKFHIKRYNECGTWYKVTPSMVREEIDEYTRTSKK